MCIRDRDTLRVGAETESNELFDKSHGFYIAVIQGFFRDYYYTRGSAFSFLAEEKPEYARYFTPWAQVTPTAFPNPAENQIIENYCSGVYPVSYTHLDVYKRQLFQCLHCGKHLVWMDFD